MYKFYMYSSMQKARPHFFLFTYPPSPMASQDGSLGTSLPLVQPCCHCLFRLPPALAWFPELPSNYEEMSLPGNSHQGLSVFLHLWFLCCSAVHHSILVLCAGSSSLPCCVQDFFHVHAVCRVHAVYRVFLTVMLYAGSSLLPCCMQRPSPPCCVRGPSLLCCVRGSSLLCCVRVFFLVIASLLPATCPDHMLASQCLFPKSLHFSPFNNWNASSF